MKLINGQQISIAFSEIAGGNAFFLFEDPVEIRYVIKAAIKRYFGNSMGGFNQHPGCFANPDIIQEIDKAFVGSLFKEVAET